MDGTVLGLRFGDCLARLRRRDDDGRPEYDDHVLAYLLAAAEDGMMLALHPPAGEDRTQVGDGAVHGL